jgi:DNA-binding CsgD family transcriptional regulator
MQIKFWLGEGGDPWLETETARKIGLLQLFEAEVPAVLVVHNVRDFSVVYMSERGCQFLGVTLEEVRLPNAEYHQRYFNPEDAAVYVPKIMGLVARNQDDELVTYLQQVRTGPQAEWRWYLSSTKIFLRDAEGTPRLTLTMAVPVDTTHPVAAKVDRLLEEATFLREHRQIFDSLTRRERDILRWMALGLNSADIAAQLHISEATVNTHRRNLRNKLGVRHAYDITRFAQAFDLI